MESTPHQPVRTPEPFCVQRIREQLDKMNGEPIAVQASRKLLVSFVECYIQNEQANRTRLDKLENILLEFARREEKKREEDSDTFKSLLDWLKENLLPRIVELAALGFIAWLILQIRGG